MCLQLALKQNNLDIQIKISVYMFHPLQFEEHDRNHCLQCPGHPGKYEEGDSRGCMLDGSC